MIVSHRYRFVFIKTVKTAGTSVEIALSQHCGPRDIITRIDPADELIRERLGYRGPQNYLADWSELTARDIDALFERRLAKPAFSNHMGAEAARRRLGAATWNSYFKFTLERNPWDKMISYLHFINGEGADRELGELILSGDGFACRGFPLYTIDGAVAVDQIVRFENIQEDLERVAEHLGMPPLGPLPRAKSHFRKDRRSYREIMSEELRQAVTENCAPEIALLGYEF